MFIFLDSISYSKGSSLYFFVAQRIFWFNNDYECSKFRGEKRLPFPSIRPHGLRPADIGVSLVRQNHLLGLYQSMDDSTVVFRLKT